MEERLQKIMSSCGLCSRRQAETWIQAGRVTVNGTVAVLGAKADLQQDVLAVDGVPVSVQPNKTYLMLHKPRYCVCTLSDEQGRKTVADLVSSCHTRLWPVGRLDFLSEGLLVMCDDGDLTQQVLHPSHETEKEYHLWVKGNVEKALPLLSQPMTLWDQVPEGEKLAPAQVKILKKEQDVTKLSFLIHQGKNRQLRRMCTQAELVVLRLKRVREGKLVLDAQLKPGQWRNLTDSEIALLKD